MCAKSFVHAFELCLRFRRTSLVCGKAFVAADMSCRCFLCCLFVFHITSNEIVCLIEQLDYKYLTSARMNEVTKWKIIRSIYSFDVSINGQLAPISELGNHSWELAVRVISEMTWKTENICFEFIATRLFAHSPIQSFALLRLDYWISSIGSFEALARKTQFKQI